MKDEYRIIGEGIKHFRKIRGYSRVEFAKLLNVSPYLLDKMENGSRSAKGRLDRICKYLCVTREEIYLYKPNLHVKKVSEIERVMKNKRAFFLTILSMIVLLVSCTILLVDALFLNGVKSVLEQNKIVGTGIYSFYGQFNRVKNISIVLIIISAFIFVVNALVEIYKKLKFETGRTLYVDLTPKQEEENKNNE